MSVRVRLPLESLPCLTSAASRRSMRLAVPRHRLSAPPTPTLADLPISASVAGDTQQVAERWQAVETLVIEREDEIHSVFDVYLFLNSMQRKFRIR